MKKKRHQHKGQSTVEYIIVVAAVIAAILIFARKGGLFQDAFNTALDININSMLSAGERILE